jgi:hypothetical protein
MEPRITGLSCDPGRGGSDKQDAMLKKEFHSGNLERATP